MLEIDLAVLRKTTWCTKNFKCLQNGNCNYCQITRAVSKEVHFVNCPDSDCSYKMSYGESWICNCPTRKEIYNKYGILLAFLSIFSSGLQFKRLKLKLNLNGSLDSSLPYPFNQNIT